MNRNIMITGCGGFLGSHLASRHLALGDQVWGIDNFCSSDRNSPHLKMLMNDMKFRFSTLDICDFDLSNWYLSCVNHGLEPDIIYNMACPASPPIYQAMPIETTMTCTQGTNKMLKFAWMLKNRHVVVVHASTSEVYGDPLVDIQRENYYGNVNSYGPRSCYDEGKRAAEALCYDYLNKHDVDVRLVRIFNTYGPRMHKNDGRVVSNFICQRLRDEKMTAYGDGSQTRSFCYVDDTVEGIMKLAALPQNPRTPINIGNPNEITINQLIKRVCDKIDPPKPPLVAHSAFPVNDPYRRRPDISLAKEILDWEPRVSLDEGLFKTIEYFRSVL